MTSFLEGCLEDLTEDIDEVLDDPRLSNPGNGLIATPNPGLQVGTAERIARE